MVKLISKEIMVKPLISINMAVKLSAIHNKSVAVGPKCSSR